MRAIVFDRYGEPDTLRLETREIPVPSAGEVLLRLRAASVNDWDLARVRGEFFNRLMNGLTGPRLQIPGSDVAGEVVSVGEGAGRFEPGDRVYGDLCRAGFGGFADYVAAPESCLARIPEDMSDEAAASLPQAGTLAWQGLFDVGHADGGVRSVLLNGAGGGVGTFAVQFLRPLDVLITCVDRADKLAALTALGADRTLDYRQVDFTRDDGRYDLILDARTTRPASHYARALNSGGTYATVGGSMKHIIPMAMLGKFFLKRYGVHLKVVSLTPNRYLEQFNEAFETGRLRPVIDSVFPLEDTPAALARFARSDHTGKIVIRMD